VFGERHMNHRVKEMVAAYDDLRNCCTVHSNCASSGRRDTSRPVPGITNTIYLLHRAPH
jgi:hypothetical protein